MICKVVLDESVRLHQVRDASNLGIFPQALESVEVAGLGLEDVNQDISVIDGHPKAVLESDRALVALVELLADVVGEVVGYAVDVGGRGAFADDKVLESGLLDVAHIDYLNVTGLAVLKTLDDSVYELVGHSYAVRGRPKMSGRP